MRILLLITLGFAGAMASCAYGPSLCWWGIGLFLLPFLFLWKRERLRKLSLITLGLSLGFFWFSGFDALYLQPAELLDGQEQTLTVVLEEPGKEMDWGSSVTGRTRLNGRSYRVRLNLHETAPEPGTVVRGTFALRSNLSGDRAAGRAMAGGVFLTGTQQGALLRLPGEGSFRSFTARLRMKLTGQIQALFPQDVSDFAAALLLGDSSRLPDSTRWKLSASGLAHVAAVSGLHVAILCQVISMLVGKKQWLTFLLNIPVLFLFCGITGFTPSVTRAAMMILLMELAPVIGKDSDSLTALALAALVMLLFNPLVITSISFQMSAASVLGILTMGRFIQKALVLWIPRKKGWKQRIYRFLFDSLSITLGATIPVLPLSAFYFGSVSLLAPISNLLLVWMVPWIFWGILLSLIFSFLWFPAASVLAAVTAWPIRLFLAVAGVIARIPFACLYTVSLPMTVWLGGVYLLGILFLLRRRRKPVYYGAAAVVGLAAALILSWLPPRMDALRMTVFDVGQGQCILLQSRGHNILVDCGGSKGNAGHLAADTLLSQGFSHLDGLILTSLDREHTGGVEGLLGRVDTDRIYLPVTRESLPRDSRITLVADRLDAKVGEGKLQIFGGNFRGPSNETGLCVLFDAENYDILITGGCSSRGERNLLRKSALPLVSCLIPGGSGAGDCAGRELLDRVRPETVVLSADGGNPQQQPDPELLLRLRDYTGDIRRTDLEGTVFIRR